MSTVQKAREHKLQELAKRIQQARKRARLSQLELARAIGISDKAISAYEKGRAIPPLPKLREIASQTKRPLEYFTGGDTTLSLIEKRLQTIENELAEIKKLLFPPKD